MPVEAEDGLLYTVIRIGVGHIASIEQLLPHDMPITQRYFRSLHRDNIGQLIREDTDGLGDPEAIHALKYEHSTQDQTSISG